MSFDNNGDVIQLADVLGGDEQIRRLGTSIKNGGYCDYFRWRSGPRIASVS
jgi:hypothetical protein